MKKLTLKGLQPGAAEMLTRAQLRKVLGGAGSGCTNACQTHGDCGDGKKCSSASCPDDPNFNHTICS